jgi:hypothetical protein
MEPNDDPLQHFAEKKRRDVKARLRFDRLSWFLDVLERRGESRVEPSCIMVSPTV